MPVWIEACSVEDVDDEDLIRVDHAGKSYAVYLGPDGAYYCTDGLCTHEQVHLAGGLVDGFIVECPKHNGRFDYRTGAAKGAPVCVNLGIYPARAEGGRVYIEV